MKKKFLAILLATLTIMAMLPTVAFAADSITEVDVTFEYDYEKGKVTLKSTNSSDFEFVDFGLMAFKDGGKKPAYQFYDSERGWRDFTVEEDDIYVSEIPAGKADYYLWSINLDAAANFEFSGELSVTVDGKEIEKMAGEGYGKNEYSFSSNQKVLSLWIAVDIPTAPSGSANVKGEITAADFGYSIVIPSATTLTEDNHTDVLLGGNGKVSIENVKHGADNINVFYTVDLSNGKLTDGTHDIATTYKYKQGEADYAALTDGDSGTKVTVYTGGNIVDSYVNVTADDTQWKAAPVGDYNASVVFNFDQTQAAAVMTIGDIFPDDLRLANKSTYLNECYNDGVEGLFAAGVIEPDSAFDELMKEESSNIAGEFAIILPADLGVVYSVPLTTAVTPVDGGYQYVGYNNNFGKEDTGDVVTVFKMESETLTKISITVRIDTNGDHIKEITTVDLEIGAKE